MATVGRISVGVGVMAILLLTQAFFRAVVGEWWAMKVYEFVVLTLVFCGIQVIIWRNA